MDSSLLMWGVLFGAVGYGFFRYGKKQGAFVPLVVGITLCVFPYFINNVYLLVAIGFGLIAVPYFVKM